MNLSGDGKLDGIITIKKGQGISQAIAAELKLTEAECKQIGSLWNQIVDIAEEQSSYTEDSSNTYTEGATIHEGQEFKFNKAAFESIMKLVNEKLGKNLQFEDTHPIDGTGENPPTSAEEETPGTGSETDTPTGPELTEEDLPSVLLRNSALVSTAVIIKAIRNPQYRKQVLPKLANLTEAEQKLLLMLAKNMIKQN